MLLLATKMELARARPGLLDQNANHVPEWHQSSSTTHTVQLKENTKRQPLSSAMEEHVRGKVAARNVLGAHLVGAVSTANARVLLECALPVLPTTSDQNANLALV